MQKKFKNLCVSVIVSFFDHAAGTERQRDNDFAPPCFLELSDLKVSLSVLNMSFMNIQKID